MNATKFVKLKRNFPKLRPTVKRNLKVDKLHKIQMFQNKFVAESIASPAVGDQPSWAHVVKGGVSVVPPPPIPPPPVIPNPQLFRNPFAKAALKVVPKAADAGPVAASLANVDKEAHEHSYALANPPSPAMEISVGDVENISMEGNTSSGESQFPHHKKAKLGADLVSVDILSNSPDLPHKQPRSREQQENDNEDIGDSCGEDSLEHSNLHGMKFIMWFEIGIEGKDPMDRDEDDWGGKLQ